MSSANRALVERFYDEVINGGRLDVVDEIVAPDFREHGAAPSEPGREDLKAFLRMLGAAFTDLRLTVDEWIAERDLVVARVTLTGTHRGEFYGVAPTGRDTGWTAIHIWRIAGGRLAERWAEADLLGLMQRLGAIE